MEEFNDIISKWKGQQIPDNGDNLLTAVASATSNASKAKKLQQNTILVLGATILVLIAFAFFSSQSSTMFYFGLSVMIFALLLRVAIEMRSITKLNRISKASGTLLYVQSLRKLYLTRKRIHGVFTYLLLLLYAVGFCLLLPTFKLTLPHAFYTYIVVCGIVLLLVIAIFIAFMNRKELKTISRSLEKLSEVETQLQ